MKNQLYGVLGEGGEEKGGRTRGERKTKGEKGLMWERKGGGKQRGRWEGRILQH